MKTLETSLPDVLICEPAVFEDGRGIFYELFSSRRYAGFGVPAELVQDNLVYSTRGVLRGLHYQHPRAQGKLVTVLRGSVFDVAVDVRVGSPRFGQWCGFELSGENRRQAWIPPGFAHGFCVTSDDALFLYKCSEYYQPTDEGTVAWDDPELGIVWPIAAPNLSGKDRLGIRLAEIPLNRLPVFEGLR